MARDLTFHLKAIAKVNVYMVFVFLIIVASVVSPVFLTPLNIFNILRQITPLGMVAVGMTFVILTGGIDLSVGSMMTLLVALVCGIMNFQNFRIPLAVLGVLGAGSLMGFGNGTAVTRVGIPPFVATLGGMAAFRGLVLMYTTGYPMHGTTEIFRSITGGKIGPVPWCVFMFVGVAIAAYIVLRKTVFGRRVYAVGGNRTAARLAGIPVRRVELMAYVICGLLTGLGAIVLASRLGVADPLAGIGYELDAIAAVVIGGTSLMGGVGGIGGTVTGVLIMGVINNLLNLLNVNAFLQMVVKGLIIVTAVGIYSLRERSKEG
jgi:ribose/xylose/arabinose/galactoside ABC-type transport system permease subunit